MGKTITVLFLGGAKRVSMARMFKAAGSRMGVEVRLFSFELDAVVPIACEATVVQGGRWSDADIIEQLDAAVQAHGVDIVIPFVDGAVGVAAEYVSRYPGRVFSPVSAKDVSELMFDKVKSAMAFERMALPIPHTYRPGEPNLRLIAKPRHGSASKGIVCINSIEALDGILMKAADYLVQERIDNRREITVDCYVSVSQGMPLVVSPRVRLATVGGEVSDTVTVDMPAAVALAKRVIADFDLRGAVTVQLIEDLDVPGRLLVMEVNPRFGGGAVCTVAAGADLPRLVLEEAMELQVAPITARSGVRICRYQQEVVFVDGKLA